MFVYQLLGRVFPKSYVRKVFSAAFVGVHVPLIGLIGYALMTTPAGSFSLYQGPFVWMVLATVLGTALTWWALHALLEPLFLVERSMARYEREGVIETLPSDHRDEVGRLMAQVNRLVFHAEARLHGVREEADTDPLTHLLNRRGFEARFPARGVAGQLILIDLNQFKPINDRFGHAAGDAVLQHVASALRHTLRLDGDCYDLACRWGGDEFLVFARAVDPRTTHRIVAAIQDAIEVNLPIGTVEIPVRCALGRVAWHGVGGLEEAVSMADAQMYAHKASRRAPTRVVEPTPIRLEAC